VVAAGQTRETKGRSMAVGLRQTWCRAVRVDMDRLKQVVAVIGGESHVSFVVGFTLLLVEPMVLLVL